MKCNWDKCHRKETDLSLGMSFHNIKLEDGSYGFSEMEPDHSMHAECYIRMVVQKAHDEIEVQKSIYRSVYPGMRGVKDALPGSNVSP